MREPTQRKVVFGLSWLSYASYYLGRKNFSVAKAAVQARFHLTRGQLGDIDTAFQATYAAGQFLWGFAADRVGSRRIIAMGMLLSAACVVAFGMSSGVGVLLLFWGLNGLFQSTGWPANVKSMGAFFGRGGRGAVMGLWSTCYQVGSLVANPITAWFLLTWASWRAAFWGPAIVVAAVGVVIFAFLPEREHVSAGASAGGLPAEDRAAARARVLRTPLVWILGASYFFLKLTRYVLLLWLPYFMSTKLAYGPGRAAVVPLAFEAGGFVGSVTIGWISERLLEGRRLGISIVSLLGLAAALVLYAHAAETGVAANVVSLGLVGFFLFGPDTLVAGSAAQDLGGPAAAATAAGLINGLGSLGPILQGRFTSWVSEGYGWATLFSILGAGALISAAILTPSWWRGRRRR